MKTPTVLRISDLTDRFRTREDAADVFRKFQSKLDADFIEIELTQAGVMGSGFLDGLVDALHNSGRLDSVTFIVDNEYARRKLVLVANLRKLTLYLRSSSKLEKEMILPDHSPRQWTNKAPN